MTLEEMGIVACVVLVLCVIVIPLIRHLRATSPKRNAFVRRESSYFRQCEDTDLQRFLRIQSKG